MADLEIRFPEKILLNSIISTAFKNDHTVFGSGAEVSNIVWQYPLKKFRIPQRDLVENITTLERWFRIASGSGKKFRLKDPYDYKSTALMSSAIADTDQAIGTGDGATLTFQLKKTYTESGETSQRLVTKPVAGTTVISIADVSQTNDWSVDTTTGVVTFNADVTGSITNITQASQAVVTSTAHGLVVDDTVHIKNVSGMSEINTLRGTVVSKTANTFTLDINSSGFSAYTSGGTFHTLPQSGESVKAGYEYDLKVRFDQDELDIVLVSGTFQSIDSLNLIERR